MGGIRLKLSVMIYLTIFLMFLCFIPSVSVVSAQDASETAVAESTAQDSLLKISSYHYSYRENTRYEIGEKIWFQIENPFDSTTALKNQVFIIYIEGIGPAIRTFIEENKIIVEADIPKSNDLIGALRVDLILDNEAVYSGHIIIGGKEPKIYTVQPGAPSLILGNDYSDLVLTGENITSIDTFKTPEDGVLHFRGDIDYTSDRSFIMQALVEGKEVPKSDTLSFITVYRLKKDNSDINGKLEPKERDNTKIIIDVKKSNLGTVIISPSKLFLNQIEEESLQEFEFELKSDPLQTRSFDVTSNPVNSIAEGTKLEFLPNSPRKKIDKLRLRNVSDGNLGITLSVNNVPKFAGNIEILATPVITSITSKNNLQLDPYEDNGEIITIIGNNLENVDLYLYDNSEPEMIRLTEQEYSKKKKTVKAVAVEFINKSFTRDSYKIGFVPKRKDVIETEWKYPTNHSIIIKKRKLPQPISDFVWIQTDTSNNIKQNFSEIDFDLGKTLKVVLDPNRIKAEYGPQAIEIKATLKQDYQTQVGTIQLKDLSSGSNFITLDSNYGNTIDWDITHDFKYKGNQIIQAWDEIILDIKHHSASYDITTSEKARLEAKEVLIRVNGSGRTKWIATSSFPPILWAFRGGKFQTMPFNVGFGVKRQFRDDDNNLKPYGLGVYFFGLNIAQTEERNESVGSTDSTAVDNKKDDFISQGMISTLFLFEYSLNTTTRGIKFPILAGWGFAVPKSVVDNRGFGKKVFGFLTFGFGVSIPF